LGWPAKEKTVSCECCDLSSERSLVAEIELTADSVIVHVKGADRVFALKSELTIPLEHVVGVSQDEEEARRWYHGVRAPGTNVPGVITAGTFYRNGERVFWDVHHPERAIALSLRNESYAKLVVEVESPEATILAIEAALGGPKPA
jgi:hypothetical protein